MNTNAPIMVNAVTPVGMGSEVTTNLVNLIILIVTIILGIPITHGVLIIPIPTNTLTTP